jgi:hypothetical protein
MTSVVTRIEARFAVALRRTVARYVGRATSGRGPCGLARSCGWRCFQHVPSHVLEYGTHGPRTMGAPALEVTTMERKIRRYAYALRPTLRYQSQSMTRESGSGPSLRVICIVYSIVDVRRVRTERIHRAIASETLGSRVDSMKRMAGKKHV